MIPKNDSTGHTISDFRELNKCIVRKPYPIPKISTMLQELEGFTYATALDLNTGYYTIRLDPVASKVCTITQGESNLIRDYPWALEASGYNPSPNNGPDGILRICVCIHRWFTNHH
jgi:hypothetical protein